VTQQRAGTAVVLVSPNQEDQHILGGMLDRSEWIVLTADTLERGLTLAGQNRVPIIVCERDLPSGSWKDLLAEVLRLPRAPYFILMSRLGDECLWGDALSLGAWDVLLKPLDATEVMRILSSAWRHWNERYGVVEEIRKATGAARPLDA
jgi:DNA-binding NtrC family response regulator